MNRTTMMLFPKEHLIDMIEYMERTYRDSTPVFKASQEMQRKLKIAITALERVKIYAELELDMKDISLIARDAEKQMYENKP